MPKTLLTLLLVCTGYYTLAADISVTGTVLSLDGLPEGGVNVIVKGTAIATATDMNGHFTIHVPEGNAVLIFHFLRRKPVEHSILLRQGFQYQVNVGLSRKTQTFNKSMASTSSLPLNAPVIRGRITDEQNAPLANVSVTQSNNGFKTISAGRPSPSGVPGQKTWKRRYRQPMETYNNSTSRWCATPSYGVRAPYPRISLIEKTAISV